MTDFLRPLLRDLRLLCGLHFAFLGLLAAEGFLLLGAQMPLWGQPVQALLVVLGLAGARRHLIERRSAPLPAAALPLRAPLGLAAVQGGQAALVDLLAGPASADLVWALLSGAALSAAMVCALLAARQEAARGR